jgi:hypothetical protein
LNPRGLKQRNWKVFAIGVLTVLTLSGLAIAPAGASSPGSHYVGSLPPAEFAPSSLAGVTSSTIHVGGLTYSGAASTAVLGPFHTTASAAPVGLTADRTNSAVPHAYPQMNPRAAAAINAVARANSHGPISIPSVSCQPLGAGCDTISSSSGGATGVKGINAVDSSALYGLTIEPADQGVCAGNGYTMEVNNLGEMMVFSSALHLASSDISLDSVMGLGSVPASLGGPWSSGGDISCLYDYDHGGHWFITEFVSNSSWAVAGPFGGCFAGKAFGCWEGIAVSVTNNPLGAYNVYYFNPNYNPSEPGYPYLLNDFAKIGTTSDAFLLFYDEFPLYCGGFGGGCFNGAQEIAINKKALELGYPAITSFGTPNPYFTMVAENMGLIATPDGTCTATSGGDCWYQVIPAQSPDPSQFDNSHGGTGFMVGALDFNGAGDNRIAVFAWTGLSHLNSYNCGTCSSIHFRGQVFRGVEAYFEPGLVAPQKHGPIPLGDACVAYGLNATSVTSCAEGGIATNGDGFTQASLAGGQIWAAMSTEINQQYATGTGCPCVESHIGVAYFVIGQAHFDKWGTWKLTNQAYISAMHEELEFPAVAAEGSFAQDGGNLGAIMTFSLSGNGGPKHADHGGFYPSTAYGRLNSTSNGLLGSVINIADKGKGAQDGFSEYHGYGVGTRPRWGDYSEAIFVPDSGGLVYFSTNYIQYPNCNSATFAVDPSCGGTRDPFANWGTSVNFAVA